MNAEYRGCPSCGNVWPVTASRFADERNCPCGCIDGESLCTEDHAPVRDRMRAALAAAGDDSVRGRSAALATLYQVRDALDDGSAADEEGREELTSEVYRTIAEVTGREATA